jgi:hypothetical protein
MKWSLSNVERKGSDKVIVEVEEMGRYAALVEAGRGEE